MDEVMRLGGFWLLWFTALMLLWGGLFTWVIAPLLGKAGLRMERAALRSRTAQSDVKLSGAWGCLIIFGVIAAINAPVLWLIVNVSLWLAERS